jgi:hypothetical protein
MRILAPSHGLKAILPVTSQSTSQRRAVAPKASAKKANATTTAAADDDKDGNVASNAMSLTQRHALAAATLAASVIMVGRSVRKRSSCAR